MNSGRFVGVCAVDARGEDSRVEDMSRTGNVALHVGDMSAVGGRFG